MCHCIPSPWVGKGCKAPPEHRGSWPFVHPPPQPTHPPSRSSPAPAGRGPVPPATATPRRGREDRVTHSDTCYINGCRRTAAGAQHLPRHGASQGGASSITGLLAASRSPRRGRDRWEGSARHPEGLLHGVGSLAFLGPGMAGVPAQPPVSLLLLLLGDPSACHCRGVLEGAAQLLGRGRWHRRPPQLLPPGRDSGASILGATERNQFCPFPLVFFFLLLVSFLFFLLRQERLPVLLPPPPAAPCPSCPRAGAVGKGAARRPGALRRRSLLLWPGPSALCLCPAVRLSCWPARVRPRSARGRRAGARCRRSGWSS